MRLRVFCWFAILMLVTGGCSPSILASQRSKVRASHSKKTPSRQKKLFLNNGKKSIPVNVPRQPPIDREHGFENVKARDQWLMFERMYPFDSIPVDARRLAWENRPQARFQPNQTQFIWRSLGPTPTNSGFPDNWGQTSGRINTIAVSPTDPNLVLVGAATGGIWRSVDGGQTFTTTTDDQVDLAVGSIAFAKSNPSVVYAGMGDANGNYLGNGVLKSTNAGQTWTRVSNSSLPAPGRILKVGVDPTNPDRVYAAQFDQLIASGSVASSGFYVSSDGGVTWKRTLTGLGRDLAISQGNPEIVYAAMSRVDESGKPAGLYRSTDRGETWTVAYTSPFTQGTLDLQIGVTPANPQVVYIFTGGFSNNAFSLRVEVSTDGGQSWTARNTSNVDTAQFSYNAYIAVDPNNPDIVYLGTRDIFKSTNGGRAWTNLNNNFQFSGDYTPDRSSAHPDQHAFAFIPNSPNTFLSGCDGGLYRSSDGGQTFQSSNASLSLTQFYGIAVNPTDPDLIFGGTQDNGTQRRIGSSSTWDEFISGDGGQVVVNPLNPEQLFTTYVYGTIFRWRANGNVFEDVVGSDEVFGEGSQTRIAFIAPFAGNGVDSTLYFGTWRLFVSKDLGDTWKAPAGNLDLTKGIRSGFSPDVLSIIAASSANPNVIYTGSSQGRVMVTADGGRTFKDITAGLPDRFIRSIAIDRQNPATAYLTVSGFRTGHVFKTTNMGTTWADISGNLPDIPALAVLVDRQDPTTLYLGTDIGVFRSTTGGNQWEVFNNGMPPVRVTGFAVHPNGTIRVATYGRGMFELEQRDTSDTTSPTVTVTAPQGGETLSINGQFEITWQATDDTGIRSQEIALSTDAGVTFPTVIVAGLTGATQSFRWTVPETPTQQARIQVSASDLAGNIGRATSAGNFTIQTPPADTVAPTVTVLAPDGPTDKLRAGTTFLIRWQSTDNVGVTAHDVLFSTDGGATYPTTLATGLTGTAQSFNFAIPASQPKTKTARIRVIARDAAGNTGQDESNANLKIKPSKN